MTRLEELKKERREIAVKRQRAMIRLNNTINPVTEQKITVELEQYEEQIREIDKEIKSL